MRLVWGLTHTVFYIWLSASVPLEGIRKAFSCRIRSMSRPSGPTSETARAPWIRPLLIFSGAILGLMVAWLFSLVSGIPLPAWEAVAAVILGGLLGFSAGLPSSSSKSPHGS